MEITYFTLGLLTMIVFMFIGIIIWCMIRINKLEKSIINMDNESKENQSNISLQLNNVYNELGDIREKRKYELKELNENIQNRFDDLIRHKSKRNHTTKNPSD